ncbi:CZB domain-containing protein [Sulfurimonas sp. NWX367]|uniref:CZB domain-containing protein n=1 Tax=unclassified Sulfurimonas TaxID=2623549 RepID=UPI003204D21E
MKKDETLKSLENAEVELTRFVETAKSLIDGIDPEDRILPTSSRETKFGQWFYTDGQKLKILSNNPLECMSNIEELHDKLHERYREIFDLYFAEEKKGGFLSRIFKPKQKVLTESELKLVNEKYLAMEQIAEELLAEIARLQRRLVAVSEEKINALV